jgi:SAM-dependent methyltransferase
MLEIGVWKGQGIRTFKEWYGDSGEFYALDRFIKGHGLVTISQLQAEGIHSLEGDHDDTGWLRTINHVFDVIIDDGSHHWVSQINTFRIMFVNNLAPGGVFVIEDVFDDDYWGQGIIKSPNGNLKGLLNKFKTEGNIAGQLVTPEESNIICPLIDEINIYKEIVFIKKK